MNPVYAASCHCGTAGTFDHDRALARDSLVYRMRSTLETLGEMLARDAREHRIRSAYRDLPVSARVDLGIDRRRA